MIEHAPERLPMAFEIPPLESEHLPVAETPQDLLYREMGIASRFLTEYELVTAESEATIDDFDKKVERIRQEGVDKHTALMNGVDEYKTAVDELTNMLDRYTQHRTELQRSPYLILAAEQEIDGRRTMIERLKERDEPEQRRLTEEEATLQNGHPNTDQQANDLFALAEQMNGNIGFVPPTVEDGRYRTEAVKEEERLMSEIGTLSAQIAHLQERQSELKGLIQQIETDTPQRVARLHRLAVQAANLRRSVSRYNLLGRLVDDEDQTKNTQSAFEAFAGIKLDVPELPPGQEEGESNVA